MLLYAGAALLSDQPRHAQYDGERFELAAGVSHEVYHAPLGSIYWGLLAGFLDENAPVQQTLQRAVDKNVEPGELLKVSPDGNGVGYVIYATAAMRIFGPRIHSLLYAFLVLLLISSSAFIWRYRDRRLLFVPLYFAALTVLMFTVVGADAGEVSEFPIGGIRYFALFAIMPAAHVFLELADVTRSGLRLTARNAALLAIQVLLLLVAIIIRGSPAYLLGAVGTAGLMMIAAHRRVRAELRNIAVKGAYIGALGAAFFAIFYLSVPGDYKATGRTMGHLWHRVVISLAFNPAWPFGNLREVYDCRQFVPQGLVRDPADMDGIGGCIWFSLARNRHVPEAELAAHIYDSEYEGAMREAFFAIARAYPKEVLDTFFYYKPFGLLNSMMAGLHLYFGQQAFSMVIVLLAQMVVTIIFIVWGTPGAPERKPSLLGRMLALFLLWSLLPQFVAWSWPHTSADLLLDLFIGLGLALSTATDFVLRSAFVGRAAGRAFQAVLVLRTGLEGPAAGRPFQAVLFCSLALNLSLAAVFGLPWLIAAWPERRSGLELFVERIASRLPGADADLMRAAFQADQAKLTSLFEDMARARLAVRQRLAAQPLDSAALAAAVTVLRVKENAFFTALQDVALGAAGKLSPEGRDVLPLGGMGL